MTGSSSLSTVNDIIAAYETALKNWDSTNKTAAMAITNGTQFANSSFKTELEKTFTVEWTKFADPQSGAVGYGISITGIKGANGTVTPVPDTVTRAQAEQAMLGFVTKFTLEQRIDGSFGEAAGNLSQDQRLALIS